MRWVALDRDGTLIAERGYLSDAEGVEVLDGAAEALLRLRELGLRVVVATNQSGVGRGYFDVGAVEAIHARIVEKLGAAGAVIEGFYVCPHAPEEECECRKPKTGLLEQAARELGLPMEECVVVGDKAADVELGRNAGGRSILVTTGYGAEDAGSVEADFVAGSLREAVEWMASSIDS
ncbi:MAG: HAD family hydrolase [Candidatus Solibacter usitatus]|nr:HAD family hydrolase [Candidatus Solibacter usitatus]